MMTPVIHGRSTI